MKIRVEMENKELYSYAGLAEELGMGDAAEMVEQSSKNMSISSPKFSVKNIRDEKNETVVSVVEFDAELLIKIVRKLSPIISACKMIWGMFTNLFEDVAEDMGDMDDWDIDIEGEEDEEDEEIPQSPFGPDTKSEGTPIEE